MVPSFAQLHHEAILRLRAAPLLTVDQDTLASAGCTRRRQRAVLEALADGGSPGPGGTAWPDPSAERARNRAPIHRPHPARGMPSCGGCYDSTRIQVHVLAIGSIAREIENDLVLPGHQLQPLEYAVEIIHDAR